MTAESFGFDEIARILPEPLLLVSGTGEVLSVNPSVLQLLSLPAGRLAGRTLADLVTDPAEKVHQYLAACARSPQMTMGALTWRGGEGEEIDCRCEGAALRPWSAEARALVVLRLRPRKSASTHFILLNKKIEELNREIHMRRETEAALQQREVELRAFNENLEAKVKERTETLSLTNQQLREREAALERMNLELQHRNRELQEFASVASHDLQEPLRKVQTFIDLLRTEHEGRLTDEGSAYLDRIQSASSRMSRLIADLLTLSRLSTRDLIYERVDLNGIAAEVVSDLEARIGETDGRVEVAALPTIEADPLQMRQLFQNLISNALKFHRPDVPPVVKVSAALQAEAVPSGNPSGTFCRLRFEDNGIGFDEQHLDRIFSPFQRLHSRSAYEGTGMGLAICRRIVERHGGTITAESAPGRGSRFIVFLPVHQLPGSSAGFTVDTKRHAG